MTISVPFNVPRAALFVPADKPHLVAKGIERGADAVILDLEDAVAPDRKTQARKTLLSALDETTWNVPAYVRVNSELSLLGDDIKAATHPRVTGIVLPKVECPKVTGWICQQIRAQRADLNVIALIESPRALPKLSEIATCDTAIVGLAFGPEDFCAEAGIDPSPASLSGPAQAVALNAKGAGIFALGYPSTIANFKDLETLAADMQMGRQLGFDGAKVIHPAQIAVAHEVFSPSVDQIDWARRVISNFDPVSGVGQIDGKMIDRPVWLRAMRIVDG